MAYFIIFLKLFVGLSILNVWLLRSKRSTPYRGGNAQNLLEEYKVYGLPEWMFYLVGILKVGAAIVLIASIWTNKFSCISALAIAFFMLCAAGFHLKVKDPFGKIYPSLSFLILSLVIAFTKV